MLNYIKYQQKQLEKKRQRAAKLEAKKEAERIAKMEAEARKQEEIAAHKKFLLEQQENERFRQKHIQRKEKSAEQKWNKELDTLLVRIDDNLQKNNKLEEIRTIIERREPSLHELNWTTWLSDPLNQLLADLDYDYAMELFKRDNLAAKRRRKGRGGKIRRLLDNYALSFTGDTPGNTATYPLAVGDEDYVTTTFDPDDYNLNEGFTLSYWVNPLEIAGSGNKQHMFALGRKSSSSQRFEFGLNNATTVFIGVGGNRHRATLHGMEVGNWYHWVVTYAGNSASPKARKIYRNGELLTEANISWSSTGGGESIYFGGRNLSGTGYNNGWACGLDQVAIFNTAKDADWVTSVYNTNQKKLDLTNESGLVGYWKFSEGSGTTVKDYSGNGNHGTFAPISGDTTAYPTWEEI
jgi:hypothetical protein